MMDSYEDIFNRRGKEYHEAMDSCPDARDQEFKNAVDFAELRRDDVIVDLPARGGYLRKYIEEAGFKGKKLRCYHQFETSSYFAELSPDIKICRWEKIPLPNRSVNVVFSITALHHLQDRKKFYKEVSRVLARHGRFLIADIKADSTPARFLNGFVNENNSMGHKGQFLDTTGEMELLSASGFVRVAARELRYHWQFPDREKAVTYIKCLFGLDKATDEDIWKALRQHLNAVEVTQSVRIPWGLSYFQCWK